MIKLYIWLSTTKWTGRQDRRSWVAGSHVSQERALYCSSTNLSGAENTSLCITNYTFNSPIFPNKPMLCLSNQCISHLCYFIWLPFHIEQCTWARLRCGWSPEGGSVCCGGARLIGPRTRGGAGRPGEGRQTTRGQLEEHLNITPVTLEKGNIRMTGLLIKYTFK